MILTALMAHPRKLIRHAVVALLIDAQTAAGARVIGTRVEPNKKSELPALSVYTLNDPVEEDRATETEEAHELDLEIAGWVAHSDALPADDAMDDLAEEVEKAMKGDPFLGGKAAQVRFLGTVFSIVEDDGRSNPTCGIFRMAYVVEYRSPIAVEDPVDDFYSVEATHQLEGGVDDTVPAIDDFIVQETPP